MNDQDLNQRLTEALRVEPSPEQLARLESFGQQQSRADRRRRRVKQSLAIAATVLVVGTLDWLLTASPDRPPDLIADKPHVEHTPPQLATTPPIPHSPLPGSTELAEVIPHFEIPARSLGRAPTDYERIAFAMQTRQPAALPPSPLTKTIDAALDRLATNPAEFDDANDGLADAAPHAVEQQLLDRWSLADGSHRRAILRLLGEHGSSRSAPLLLRAARQPSLRDNALAAIERSGGADALAQACTQTVDPAIRRSIAERLLAADSDDAIACFLQLAAHPALAPDLLAAADALANPPTARLFNLLNADDKPMRQTAALVLGRINGPEVTAQLIALVTTDPGANEAWLALINCRGQSAHEFLATASHNPYMLGYLNHARLTSAQMLQ